MLAHNFIIYGLNLLFPVIYTGLYKLIGVIKNGSTMLVRIGNILTLSVTQTKYFPFEKRAMLVQYAIEEISAWKRILPLDKDKYFQYSP